MDLIDLHGALEVTALRAAGARIIGKTVADKLTFSLGGASPHPPPSINPRDRGALTGRSSSRSEAAAGGGLADAALGADTGGSVRVPGARCGVLACRPSHGAVPLAGVAPFAPGFDTIGWVARSERAGRAGRGAAAR
jgi:amidase